MKIVRWPLIHGALFYLVWYAVVAAAAQPHSDARGLLIQGLFVALCLYVERAQLGFQSKFLVLFTVAGSALDVVPVLFGFVTFPNTSLFVGPYPLWLVGMWACFATCYAASLQWLQGRVLMQALFGALGGPISLYAAVMLGAAEFPKDLLPTLALYSAEWALVMVASFRLYRGERS